MVATTMFGLEETLKKELLELGAKKIKVSNRCVYFQGSKEIMYKANLKLRTALKILKTVQIFKASKEDEFYKKISRIKWNKILSFSETFSVSSTVNSVFFKHSQYISLITKDAIVDQFRKNQNKRPSVDLKNPDFNIHVHISHNMCTISLNSSGNSLHKRGYRSEKFHAPINEVLAAGIILLTNWNKKDRLIDPMCGSGTFLIEAGLIAINRAPNIYRKVFGFQNWKDYNHDLFIKIKHELKNEEKKINGFIEGYDISASAISIARKHIANVKLSDFIKIKGQNFFTSLGSKDAILIFNPPYGKRIEINKNYFKDIGDILKKKYTDTHAWIISSDTVELKKIGLRPNKKIKLFNGPLECKLLKYELYSGSKKTNKFQNG